MDYKIGDQLEDLLFLQPCGTGAYGSVYLVRSVVSGRKYALKLIPENSVLSERELNGIRQYQSVCSQHDLMQIYRSGKTDRGYYYVMDAADDLNPGTEEYLSDTLQNRINKYGRIPADELLPIALQLEQCIKTLHACGLLHRDVKPSNIIFVNGRALLGDIGLVTEKTDASLAGTTAFVSPETAAGLRSFSPEDDFYALGKTLYCALTGNPPEKYPSFPAELVLSECKDIISLYNSWISEKKSPVPGRKKYVYILLSLFILILLLGIWLGGQKKNEILLQPALNIEYYKKQIESSTPLLAPEKELLHILPHLEQEKKQLWNKRTQRGLQAYQSVITGSDLEKARKNPNFTGNPEVYLRIQRKDTAVAEFDREHKNNIVLGYFSTLDWLNGERRRIENLSRISGMEKVDFTADLKKYRQKLAELEEIKKQLLLRKN